MRDRDRPNKFPANLIRNTHRYRYLQVKSDPYGQAVSLSKDARVILDGVCHKLMSTYKYKLFNLGGSAGGLKLTKDATKFRVVPGLAGQNTVSFQSCKDKSKYLRHQNFVMKLAAGTSQLFKKDASFWLADGNAIDSVWLRSINFPKQYVRHK